MTKKLDLAALKLKPITAETLSALANGRGDHSAFAPSSAEMWMTCSGSLIANLLEPDSAGIYAAEGTVAHELGEIWLRTDDRPDHEVGEIHWVSKPDGTFFEIEVTESMLDYVEAYYDWCVALPGTHYVETKVDFSDLTPIPRQRGTADHACCAPGLLTITDLKFGIGERVIAEWNKQLLLYAYGFFREWDWLYDFQRIVIRVCQPRLSHFDVWEISRADLLEFAALAKDRAHAAWRADAPRRASDKGCRWCKIAATCVAHYYMVAEKMGDEDMFDDDDDDDELDVQQMQQVKHKIETSPQLFEHASGAATLSTAQMARILPYRQRIEGWLKDIDAELESRALAGEDIPGYKLVEGRTTRSFIKDESVVVDVLKRLNVREDEIYEKKMRSPAQMEEAVRNASLRNRTNKRKMTKKAAYESLEAYVNKRPGRPTLVSLADNRDALTQFDDGLFDDVD